LAQAPPYYSTARMHFDAANKEHNPIGRIVQFVAAFGGSSFRQIHFECPHPISSPGLSPDVARFRVAALKTEWMNPNLYRAETPLFHRTTMYITANAAISTRKAKPV
jgi:hypothetical protein